ALTDTGGGSGLTGDLRYCVNQADSLGGSNTIQFAPNLAGGTIHLTNFTNSSIGVFPGPTALQVNDGITIVGSGQTILRDATAPAFRLFFVTGGGNLTLQNLTLTGGLAQGGAGGGGQTGINGGGGAAGMGGAIFN